MASTTRRAGITNDESIAVARKAVVMPQFGSEPRFEPEPPEPNSKFGSRFRALSEPNLKSSSRFSWQ
jgi:hypothetical protein